MLNAQPIGLGATGGGSGGAVSLGNDVWLIVNNGPPDATVGAGVTGKGSLCLDYANGVAYSNAGTKAVPDWHGLLEA